MMVLDAGAFVAFERTERAVWVRLKDALIHSDPPVTHSGVAVTVELGRSAGVLLAASGMSDVVDAAVVALANHGDRIVTSDPGDIARLVEVSGRRIDVVTV